MRRPVVLLAILLAASACGERKEEAAPPAPPPASTVFQPPEDGRLTEEQVRTYLQSKPDVRTSQEYRWVEDRVREARRLRASYALTERLWQSRRKYLASLDAQKARLSDPMRKAEIDRQIATFRKDAEEADPKITPALRHNIALIERHEKPR
jgi:hypothetical protein